MNSDRIRIRMEAYDHRALDACDHVGVGEDEVGRHDEPRSLLDRRLSLDSSAGLNTGTTTTEASDSSPSNSANGRTSTPNRFPTGIVPSRLNSFAAPLTPIKTARWIPKSVTMPALFCSDKV